MGSGGCAAGIAYDGVAYVEVGPRDRRALRLGEPMEGAVQPACNDGGPPYEEDGAATGVWSLEGVPASAALVSEDRRDLYLAAGFLPDLASHPLHRHLHRTDGPWINRKLRRRCRRPARLEAEVRVAPGLPQLQYGDRWINMDGRTRYRGPLRDGLPHVEDGDRIAVRGSRCRTGTLIADAIRIG